MAKARNAYDRSVDKRGCRVVSVEWYVASAGDINLQHWSYDYGGSLQCGDVLFPDKKNYSTYLCPDCARLAGWIW